jgi:hypothetical protein
MNKICTSRKQAPEVPEAFRKVKSIKKSILSRREKNYDWKLDEFGRFHRDGLSLMLREESAKLRDYWKMRIRSYGRFQESRPRELEDTKTLFEPKYWWTADSSFTAIGEVDNDFMSIETPPKLFFPDEETVKILVLLSENHHALNAPNREMVGGLFRVLIFIKEEEQADILPTVLHPPAIRRLIDGLEGGDVAELIMAAWRVEEGITNLGIKVPGTVRKVIKDVHGRKLDSLGDYFVLNPLSCDNVIIPLREHGGEKGLKMAEHIITRLNEAARNLKRTLNRLEDPKT